MYTLEDRMRAVNLYLKYGGNSAAVRRELGGGYMPVFRGLFTEDPHAALRRHEG